MTLEEAKRNFEIRVRIGLGLFGVAMCLAIFALIRGQGQSFSSFSPARLVISGVILLLIIRLYPKVEKEFWA